MKIIFLITFTFFFLFFLYKQLKIIQTKIIQKKENIFLYIIIYICTQNFFIIDIILYKYIKS